MIIRVVIVAAVLSGLSAGATLALGAPAPIGPKQAFLGEVNGASANARIDMACFGAIRPGQTGHPMAGQSTEVVRASAARVAGFTGSARQIRATLTYPSPTQPLPIVLGTFSDYFVKAPISTGLEFPCAGGGNVTFTPVNGGPTARPWKISVTFVGQP